MSEKISQMTSGGAAQTGDILPIVRSGANLRVTAASVAALASGGVPAGNPVWPIPAYGSPGWAASPAAFIGGNETAFIFFSGVAIQCLPSKWNININVVSSAFQITSAVMLKTNPNSGAIVSSTPITWSGVSNPTLQPGDNPSDNITLQLDAAHNWYIAIYIAGSGGDVAFPATSGAGGPGGSYFGIAGDQTAVSPIVFSGGNLYAGQFLITSILSA